MRTLLTSYGVIAARFPFDPFLSLRCHRSLKPRTPQIRKAPTKGCAAAPYCISYSCDASHAMHRTKAAAASAAAAVVVVVAAAATAAGGRPDLELVVVDVAEQLLVVVPAEPHEHDACAPTAEPHLLTSRKIINSAPTPKRDAGARPRGPLGAHPGRPLYAPGSRIPTRACKREREREGERE